MPFLHSSYGPGIVLLTLLLAPFWQAHAGADPRLPYRTSADSGTHACEPVLSKLNQGYAEVHYAKEAAFWASMQGHGSYVEGRLETAEQAWNQFVDHNSYVQSGSVRRALESGDLHPEDRAGLERTLQVLGATRLNNPASAAIRDELLQLNSEVSSAQRNLKVSFLDPLQGNASVSLPMGKAGEQILAEPNEARRKAIYQGIEQFHAHMLTDTKFLEVVKLRNRLARSEGFQNYFAMKVKRNEGITLEELFSVLDDLERNTRSAQKRLISDLVQEKGAAVLEAWNFGYLTQGTTSAELDAYFPLSEALIRSGRSLSGLGVHFGGATLSLDLINRDSKYQNGFMHGPRPAYVEGGVLREAEINVSSNANPGVVGTGRRMLKTLLHELGHAAHFAGMRPFTPLDAQEHLASSIAGAELQSMFVDSLMSDPLWLHRYARASDGAPMPPELITRSLVESSRLKVMEFRRMLAVSFFEKALYEMPEEDLRPGPVARMIEKVNQRFLMIHGNLRPFLAMVHPVGAETSAYYHGYTLAMMGVYQTTEFFRKRDGTIVDNPRVGRDLAETYWAPGNSQNFFTLIKNLTGEPFNAAATIAALNLTPEDIENSVQRVIREQAPRLPSAQGPVNVGGRIRMVHGEETIATSEEGFERMAEKYSAWLARQGSNH